MNVFSNVQQPYRRGHSPDLVMEPSGEKIPNSDLDLVFGYNVEDMSATVMPTLSTRKIWEPFLLPP